MALESTLKRTCRLHVENKYGGKLISSSPKGHVGYPDSDLLLPRCPIVKIEFKRSPKANVSGMQDWWMKWLTNVGIHYWRIDDYEEFVQRCKDHYHYESR